MYRFCKAGAVLFGVGGPSFRFYLFVNALHKQLVLQQKG